MEEYISREAAKARVLSLSGKMLTSHKGVVFTDDVLREIESIPAADVLNVDKAMRFIENYAFKDEKEAYTNGAVLVPLFRVKQALVDKAYNGFFAGP